MDSEHDVVQVRVRLNWVGFGQNFVGLRAGPDSKLYVVRLGFRQNFIGLGLGLDSKHDDVVQVGFKLNFGGLGSD